jgi:hypothetical protein
VLIYALFAVSQNLSLVVFGRAVTIPGIFALEFPKVVGWAATGDGLAAAIGVFLVPVHCLILLLTARKLVSVVSINMQKK